MDKFKPPSIGVNTRHKLAALPVACSVHYIAGSRQEESKMNEYRIIYVPVRYLLFRVMVVVGSLFTTSLGPLL
jgi:hypothetical protein